MIDPEKSAQITLAVYKALSRPEILPYLREQIIRDTIWHLDNLTKEEVASFLESRGKNLNVTTTKPK